MPQAVARSASAAAAPAARVEASAHPFLGLIDSVLVAPCAGFDFPGAISRDHAAAAWTWMRRDLAPDLLPDAPADDPDAARRLDALVPQLLERAKAALADAQEGSDAARRLRTQLGGEEQWQRLPLVLQALRCRALLTKAQTFGRAANGIAEEAALAQALQAMPLQDQAVSALLMQAAVGQVSSPGRLVTAVIRIAGSASEAAVQRAGFAPLVEALLAHAQDQLPILQVIGPFADIDLTCRAIDRFHRLARALNYLELTRNGRWAMIIAALTTQVSERVEPRLRDVSLEVNRALRRARDGTDRLDSDQVLSALNGVYMLATVRDCRESLALNALFDRTWTEVGEGLEVHIQRNLDMLRQNPADRIVAERLTAAIKMAELRFNAEYADVLRRAKEAAERR